MTPRRWTRTAVVVVACLTPSATHAQATAEPAPRQTRVLSLHTLPKDAAFIDTTERIYRSVLAGALGDRLDYSSEQLADYHFPDPSGEPEFEDYLVRKYRDRPLDLLLASGVTAAIFAGRLQARLPSHPPIVFSGLFSERRVPKSTGCAYTYAMKESLDLALRIHPDTREVFLVSGASPNDKWNEGEFRLQVPVPPPGVRFTSLQGLSVRDLSERLAALPQHSIIFLVALTSDENGRTFQSEGLVDRLAASSTAPIYTWNGNVSGPFGGRLLSTDLVASSTIDLALRVLRGEPAESIPLKSIDASVDALDWRQLDRWNVSEAGVPSGVLLRFREPGLFEEYRNYVVTALGLMLLQMILIAGLLVQRRNRQVAEEALRANEGRLRQSHAAIEDLAGRLITAQEAERARIARDLHDDISQQLAGLGLMLSTLKRQVAAPDSHPGISEAVGILQGRTSGLVESVRNLSHELHPGLIEQAGLVAALDRHCAEVAKQHQVTVTFSADEHLDSVRLDVALCLFRVTQEALRNAVRHAHPHTIRVQVTAARDGVQLEIIDDGVGFVIGERVRNGLGLRSIDERVRLSGGTVEFESLPGQGTTVRIRIPQARGASS